MHQHTYDISSENNDDIKLQKLNLKNEYYISFIVIFKSANRHDILRIYSHENIINEIVCDSKIKIIDVPICFQQNIEFEMISDQDNQCDFYFVTLSHTRKDQYRSKRWIKALFTTNNLMKGTFLEYIPYAVSLLGLDINERTAKPNKNRIKFSACLNPVNTNHEEIWFDRISGKQYMLLGVSDLIANFRPGYACFYVKKNRHQKKHPAPKVNVFYNVEFVLEKNLVKLTKSNGSIMVLPIDHLLRVKKIINEVQYLDFVYDSVIFFPSVIINWQDFKL